MKTHSLRWSFCSTARTGKKPKFQSNGSERSCCSLYGRSHRFRWRLFFIPFEKNEKHLPFLIDAFPAQKRRSVEIIGVAVAHPVKICVQPKFVEQRCLPLCFLLTAVRLVQEIIRLSKEKEKELGVSKPIIDIASLEKEAEEIARQKKGGNK